MQNLSSLTPTVDNIFDTYNNKNLVPIRSLSDHDRHMTNDELKNVGTKDVVLYKRDDRFKTKVKRPIETSDTDDEFMSKHNDMHKLMEYRQIHDFYPAQRHIQSTMEGDTPVKKGKIANVLTM